MTDEDQEHARLVAAQQCAAEQDKRALAGEAHDVDVAAMAAELRALRAEVAALREVAEKARRLSDALYPHLLQGVADDYDDERAALAALPVKP